MKRIVKISIIVFAFIASMIGTVNAQKPYNQSIGVTVGNYQAVTYKLFPVDHFGIQLDLGTKYAYYFAWGDHLWSFELAPSFMYEGNFVAGLWGFAGLGGSLGFSFYPPVSYFIATPPYEQYRDIMGKAGAHGIFGLEYKFNIPLTLQFDVRPGYRFQFNDQIVCSHTFEWSANFGIRYTF